MNISDNGIAFIVDFEGIRLYLYDDGGTGRGNATIGIGHLVHYGPTDGRQEEAPFVNGITEQEAYDLFRSDVASRVQTVLGLSPQLNQSQLDAMVSFHFNTGAYGAICDVVNAGGDVCAAILQYVKPEWARDALTRRRKAECELFNTPVEGESMPTAEYDELKITDDAIKKTLLDHALANNSDLGSIKAALAAVAVANAGSFKSIEERLTKLEAK